MSCCHEVTEDEKREPGDTGSNELGGAGCSLPRSIRVETAEDSDSSSRTTWEGEWKETGELGTPKRDGNKERE